MYRHFFKRVLDIVCALLALTVFSPLFVALMIVGVVEMKGNPFFIQPRMGYHERVFKLIKFRTMTNENYSNGDPLPDEVRLTEYGRFLRSTSLDELPEAINILIGDMSVIGPRPWLVGDLVFMSEEEKQRQSVRPGLSGLAQVNGRNGLNWEDRIKYDLIYIVNITFGGDADIVKKSVLQAFFHRKGIASDGNVTDEDYGDYLLRKGKITVEEYIAGKNEAQEIIKKRHEKKPIIKRNIILNRILYCKNH